MAGTEVNAGGRGGEADGPEIRARQSRFYYVG